MSDTKKLLDEHIKTEAELQRLLAQKNALLASLKVELNHLDSSNQQVTTLLKTDSIGDARIILELLEKGQLPEEEMKRIMRELENAQGHKKQAAEHLRADLKRLSDMKGQVGSAEHLQRQLELAAESRKPTLQEQMDRAPKLSTPNYLLMMAVVLLILGSYELYRSHLDPGAAFESVLYSSGSPPRSVWFFLSFVANMALLLVFLLWKKLATKN
ncbi:MAG: hypothetical protein ABIA93_02900 [Candidatus Woesearchaeota archaeon]